MVGGRNDDGRSIQRINALDHGIDDAFQLSQLCAVISHLRNSIKLVQKKHSILPRNKIEDTPDVFCSIPQERGNQGIKPNHIKLSPKLRRYVSSK